MYLVREQSNLVDAISSMFTAGREQAARRFLEGLSTDELRYIAAYLGTRVVDPGLPPPSQDRNQIAQSIERYEDAKKGPEPKTADRDSCCSRAQVAHQMIVLLEYLSVCSLDTPTTLPVQAGYA